MRYFRLLIICILVLNSCKKKSDETLKSTEEVEEVNYVSFGKSIIADDAIAAKSMAQHYKSMPVGDSINSKMTAKVTDVCQAKGCWMTLDLEDGSEVMVKFKDYGFFVPKDIKGKEVIINGKAFVNEVPVDEQRHYAEDAGKSKEEIALIIEPKKTFSFEADGVLVVQ
ncbi:branched-chain amino acid aminotransferase [Tamlana nanhaiensis]|uniref:Branched-chain amino acid aminotransferase n=1 Tax=Neotamlana nanhaiensis TaxID=1382798 RepID=A0A0D7W5J5_9FLAO|nr:DUF4920 domain-containing protein [Tamlana nanhaiensis]KJD34390.1 branched-chain amino acid aminotransferase [Tamlana nanhaiensis]